MATKFNEEFVVGPRIHIDPFEYPTVNWKYALLQHVLDHPTTNDTLKNIIAHCPLLGTRKRILIDVKVQNLVPSRTSCIPGWHLDGPGNPLHPSRSEFHHLYIHEEGGETEFIADPFEMEITETMTHSELVELIPQKNLRIAKASAGCFTSFTRFDFHRGINVVKPMKRLLVRLTETDVIIPSNKPFKGGVGLS